MRYRQQQTAQHTTYVHIARERPFGPDFRRQTRFVLDKLAGLAVISSTRPARLCCTGAGLVGGHYIIITTRPVKRLLLWIFVYKYGVMPSFQTPSGVKNIFHNITLRLTFLHWLLTFFSFIQVLSCTTKFRGLPVYGPKWHFFSIFTSRLRPERNSLEILFSVVIKPK